MTNYENLLNLPLNCNGNDNSGTLATQEIIKMSQRDFSENEPECTPELPAANRALFLEKVRQSNAACQSGDFATAVMLYTDALQLDPGNYILYSNRSAARLKQGQFALALQDATKARELCPQWPKAYFRQGVALQCLGRYGEALASFSAGLAQDTQHKQLLAGLMEASVKSPLRHALEPTFQQLRGMNLDQSPFVVISVVGQELLQAGQYHSAVTVLESALRIGSCSLKLRGSVFSALSSAHWALNQLDKAIGYMQQDLAVAKSLGDTAGECRAHGNLGSAYFSQGSYKEALTAHRYQLVLAMKCKDTQAAAAALTSLGHVYTAIGDYPNALASHKQCVQLVKQIGDRLQEAREIGNVGAVYLAMGEFDSAVDCHTQHLRLARKLGNQVEEARAYSNLGSSHHYRRNFAQAITFHEQVLRISKQLGDRNIEARAYAGLGHAARCAGDCVQAKKWHEKQLEMALAARDKVGEGRACSNLGIVYQLLGEHDAALKLHQAHLTIARQLHDRAGMGRAYGNIGNAYSAAGLYEAAIKYHKQELTISKEVHDRSAEASTHGNLAVAYQALGAHDMALMHYRAHLNIARELKDTAGEACALLNLGNCFSSRQEFAQAVPYYEQYLMLSQELGDVAAEGKACHFLGYVHYCIGNYREAVRYYDQDLALAKDLQDKINMGRAYCNLGLAHLALGNTQAALECQKYFLAVAHMTNHLPGKFRALGNIGDILVRTAEHEEAVKMYQRQLTLARHARERPLEAAACGALGLAHRLIKKFDKALGYHTQELTLRQEMGDLPGECKAHGHLGAVHMALGNYQNAVKCYQGQLERAQELQDSGIEAQSYGNLGIAKLNMGLYEDAIGYLEQQLGTLERVNMPTTQHDRARALGHLGDCYDALGDYEEGIKCHERHLQLATALQSYRDQERAYRGLGHSHRALGNLQEALVCLEKRLVVAHELGSPEVKAVAYGDLGNIHSALGNYEQAVNCLEHQQEIARELGDRALVSDATSALGNVYQRMSDADGALRLHKMDLEMCEHLGAGALQARACSNLGAVYESIRSYVDAVKFYEKQLALTADRLSKAYACGSLGRVFHQMGQHGQAINFLRQGLAIAQSINKSEEEAKIRYQLGLALRASEDNDDARTQMETAAQLLESVRYDQRSPEGRTSLFDLQTSCYHILQQILVATHRNEDALVAAERCKARTSPDTNSISRKTTITCSESIYDIVNRTKTNVLYFSLAGDELYAWFLQPQKGIVRFNVVRITEETLKISTEKLAEHSKNTQQKGSLLERYINMVRDNLGVNSDSVLLEGDGSGWRSSSENLLDDFANERSGFLRMVNRNHLMNSSNYSLSSLFSLGSVGGSVASLQGSTRSIGSLQGSTRSRRAPTLPVWQGPSCLHTLYNLLLEPFDDLLPSGCSVSRQGRKELILVLENELYLVPFAILRSAKEDGEYLSERCSIITIPSLQSLRLKSKILRARELTENLNTALVVGGPRIPSVLSETWGWSESPASLQEAAMVADMLQAKAIAGCNATKEAVISELSSAECVHFAANLSWKLGAVVLSPGDVVDSQTQKRYYQSTKGGVTQDEETHELSGGNIELPQLSDFILSAADVLTMKLNAKLVVLSSYHSIEPITGAGVANLAGSWLCAGAGAVLISLWPVPETAAKILLRAFYSALLQGARAARALAEAMQTVQHTKHFAHPANWAGFLLIGGNVRLSNKVAMMGNALCELMRSPDKCRDALRVCLHLVEKSLQRIHRGQKNAMYTTQKSIENKAGPVGGWKDLLMAVGFRFEPAANGIPSSVFFPQSDPEDRLSQCSASLQALLALTPLTLQALAKLVNSIDVADDIITLIRNVLTQFPPKGSAETEACIEIPLSVRLWRVAGCHELLASIGFDLTEVGQDQVTLRTGKQANRRSCQFVLQALLALFDTQEAPKSLGLDSSSSCESLADETHAELQVSVSNPALAITSTPTAVSTHITADVTKALGLGLPLPPLNRTRVISSSGSAFISYVRRRGEPDGGRTDTESIPSAPDSAGSALYPTQDSSLANTTDSELSDGYISQAHINKAVGPRLGYSSLRTPVRVSRPGGGGESDAAFTPSPPVTTQNPVEQNVSMALAHQTRIRNLYSGTGMNYLGDSVIPEMSVVPSGISRRPDSSSSASSTTDWDISGHATVLRRNNQPPQHPGHMPPLPPPRQTLPLVDSLRPVALMAPVYNNLGPSSSLTGIPLKSTTMESTSSESEIERGLELAQTPMSHFRLKPKIKLGNAQSSVAARLSKEHALFMDRLNVRTEATASLNANQQSNSGTANVLAGSRKPLSLTEEDDNALIVNASNLYFSQADTELLNEAKKELKSSAAVGAATSNSQSVAAKEVVNKANQKSIQDSIMRHMNRETPTISEVYHERNLGLGLAPPLSKLLLSKNYDDEPSVSGSSSSKLSNTCTIKSIVDAVSELELSGTSSSSSVSTANTKTLNMPAHNTNASNNNSTLVSSCSVNNTNISNVGQSNSTHAPTNIKDTCSICGEPADIICRCKAAIVQKKATLKPWLSYVPSSIVKASDLATAEILERQHKIKTNVGTIKTKAEVVASMTMTNVKRASSPFSEFCRRDEGDGRSVADSQCSSTYKTAAAVLGNNVGNSTGTGGLNSKDVGKSTTQTSGGALVGRNK
ncbi:tetratricopeptide repeat protein 28 isoform X1 [Eurosta solidaginis]|uniref:tetratricopeptide repeat protein 28 isoform X1 n=1 Tax=Eurosta solidaginis TaxID=178769 RepID=UPI0035310D1A